MLSKVLPYVWHQVLDEAIELVESELELLEVLPEHIAQPQVVHHLDEDAERLLLGHLQEERGDEEALRRARESSFVG